MFREEVLTRNRFGFLLIEADIGLAFCKVAFVATDDDRRAANILNARQAYDSIVHHRAESSLTEAENTELDEEVNQLRANLAQLGVQI